jgi:hypothetical protein
MRLPEESRPKLFLRASFALERLNEAVVAAVFVFTTIGMVLCSSVKGESVHEPLEHD